MSFNPVINCTFIIRSQAEYNPESQIMSIRCILETPTTGRHTGFVDVDTLLNALRTELTEIHNQIIPEQKEEEP